VYGNPVSRVRIPPAPPLTPSRIVYRGHLRGIAERERPSERAQRPCRDQELPRNQTCYVEYPLRGRHRIPASPAPTASSRGAVRDFARGPDPIASDGRPVAGLTAIGVCGPLRVS